MSTTPNWEELFNKENTCSNCGEKHLLCDCRDDTPDFDSMDDEYED